eukprot:TRINITY_DN3980_c0_g1_i1.p1 TRINITY_DN3980_c0_g1~~TRINITY_DN3980_c0_g1_i1.p1  ORF type:complete len:206 (+),score=22.16 TRINITY_DN3980_c0_g1_i1:44-661(+)
MLAKRFSRSIILATQIQANRQTRFHTTINVTPPTKQAQSPQPTTTANTDIVLTVRTSAAEATRAHKEQVDAVTVAVPSAQLARSAENQRWAQHVLDQLDEGIQQQVRKVKAEDLTCKDKKWKVTFFVNHGTGSSTYQANIPIQGTSLFNCCPAPFRLVVNALEAAGYSCALHDNYGNLVEVPEMVEPVVQDQEIVQSRSKFIVQW